MFIGGQVTEKRPVISVLYSERRKGVKVYSLVLVFLEVYLVSLTTGNKRAITDEDSVVLDNLMIEKPLGGFVRIEGALVTTFVFAICIFVYITEVEEVVMDSERFGKGVSGKLTNLFGEKGEIRLAVKRQDC